MAELLKIFSPSLDGRDKGRVISFLSPLSLTLPHEGRGNSGHSHR